MKLLAEESLKPYLEILKNWFDQAIRPFHMLAYMLHPLHNGKLLTTDQKKTARQWLIENHPSYLTTLIAYEAKSLPFPPSYFHESTIQTLNPITWWKGVQSGGVLWISVNFPFIYCLVLEVRLQSNVSFQTLEKYTPNSGIDLELRRQQNWCLFTECCAVKKRLTLMKMMHEWNTRTWHGDVFYARTLIFNGDRIAFPLLKHSAAILSLSL